MASRKTGTLRGVVLAGALAAVSGLCGAQQTPPGQIDYGPLAVSAVPTLGETMLAALVLLLMAAAYRSLRGCVNGRVLSSLLVVGAATVLGLTGGQMMQRAQATLASAQLSQAGGGSVSVEEGETEVVNTSGVPQQIRALRVVDPQNPLLWHWLEPLSGTPQCVVGQVLAPAGKCYVSLAQNLG